jgi:hypothetical protein
MINGTVISETMQLVFVFLVLVFVLSSIYFIQKYTGV